MTPGILDRASMGFNQFVSNLCNNVVAPIQNKIDSIVSHENLRVELARKVAMVAVVAGIVTLVVTGSTFLSVIVGIVSACVYKSRQANDQQDQFQADLIYTYSRAIEETRGVLEKQAEAAQQKLISKLGDSTNRYITTLNERIDTSIDAGLNRLFAAQK